MIIEYINVFTDDGFFREHDVVDRNDLLAELQTRFTYAKITSIIKSLLGEGATIGDDVNLQIPLAFEGEGVRLFVWDGLAAPPIGIGRWVSFGAHVLVPSALAQPDGFHIHRDIDGEDYTPGVVRGFHEEMALVELSSDGRVCAVPESSLRNNQFVHDYRDHDYRDHDGGSVESCARVLFRPSQAELDDQCFSLNDTIAGFIAPRIRHLAKKNGIPTSFPCATMNGETPLAYYRYIMEEIANGLESENEEDVISAMGYVVNYWGTLWI